MCGGDLLDRGAVHPLLEDIAQDGGIEVRPGTQLGGGRGDAGGQLEEQGVVATEGILEVPGELGGVAGQSVAQGEARAHREPGPVERRRPGSRRYRTAESFATLGGAGEDEIAQCGMRTLVPERPGEEGLEVLAQLAVYGGSLGDGLEDHRVHGGERRVGVRVREVVRGGAQMVEGLVQGRCRRRQLGPKGAHPLLDLGLILHHHDEGTGGEQSSPPRPAGEVAQPANLRRAPGLRRVGADDGLRGEVHALEQRGRADHTTEQALSSALLDDVADRRRYLRVVDTDPGAEQLPVGRIRALQRLDAVGQGRIGRQQQLPEPLPHRLAQLVHIAPLVGEDHHQAVAVRVLGQRGGLLASFRRAPAVRSPVIKGQHSDRTSGLVGKDALRPVGRSRIDLAMQPGGTPVGFDGPAVEPGGEHLAVRELTREQDDADIGAQRPGDEELEAWSAVRGVEEVRLVDHEQSERGDRYPFAGRGPAPLQVEPFGGEHDHAGVLEDPRTRQVFGVEIETAVRRTDLRCGEDAAERGSELPDERAGGRDDRRHGGRVGVERVGHGQLDEQGLAAAGRQLDRERRVAAVEEPSGDRLCL